MRVDQTVEVCATDADWPKRLARLAPEEPEALLLFGNSDLLTAPSLGYFCSVRAPGRIIVESFDIAAGLASSRGVLIGGFQSPLEREVLGCLLRGSASVIICPARSLHGMTIPRAWRAAIEEGRLLLVSAFPDALRRPTSALAERRNRLAAALSSHVLILHAEVGGRLAHLARQCSSWGIPLYCLDHPGNEDLRLLGATPFAMPSPHLVPPIEPA